MADGHTQGTSAHGHRLLVPHRFPATCRSSSAMLNEHSFLNQLFNDVFHRGLADGVCVLPGNSGGPSEKQLRQGPIRKLFSTNQRFHAILNVKTANGSVQSMIRILFLCIYILAKEEIITFFLFFWQTMMHRPRKQRNFHPLLISAHYNHPATAYRIELSCLG